MKSWHDSSRCRDGTHVGVLSGGAAAARMMERRTQAKAKVIDGGAAIMPPCAVLYVRA